MFFDDVRPSRELGRQLLPRRGQAQRDDALILRPGLALNQGLFLQGTHGIAHRGPSQVKLLGEPAYPAKLYVAEEQVNEELGLDRAQVVLLCLFPKQNTKDPSESLQRGDDLAVHVPMLRGRFENGLHSPPSLKRAMVTYFSTYDDFPDQKSPSL